MTNVTQNLKYVQEADEVSHVDPERFPEKMAEEFHAALEDDRSIGLYFVIGDDRTSADMAPVNLIVETDSEDRLSTRCPMSSDMIGDLIEAVEDGLKERGIQFMPWQHGELGDMYFNALHNDDIDMGAIEEHLSKTLKEVEILGIQTVVLLWVEDATINLTVTKSVNFKADLNSWRKTQAIAAGRSNMVIPNGPCVSQFDLSSSTISSLPSFYVKAQA